MNDHVTEKVDGWYAVVAGKEFGAWSTKAIARAGMRVEQRRYCAKNDHTWKTSGLIDTCQRCGEERA